MGISLVPRLLLLSACLAGSLALEFDLQYQTKCVMEEIADGVMALVEFSAFHKEDASRVQPLTVKVGRLMFSGGLDFAIALLQGVDRNRKRQKRAWAPRSCQVPW